MHRERLRRHRRIGNGGEASRAPRSGDRRPGCRAGCSGHGAEPVTGSGPRVRRYKPTEMWLDDEEREFAPGVHYVVGGNTKVYGSSLPRLRVADFEQTQYPSGTSPAWPFAYADLEPYYQAIEELFNVHGTTGEDPSEPWRSAPYPYPALEHEPYASKRCGDPRTRTAPVEYCDGC